MLAENYLCSRKRLKGPSNKNWEELWELPAGTNPGHWTHARAVTLSNVHALFKEV